MNAIRSKAQSIMKSKVKSFAKDVASVLYLRLPARAEMREAHDAAPTTLPLPFALTVRGRVQRQGIAPLEALTQPIAQSQRVVLLFAASDVTVLRIAIPPLPASRLRAALPALLEDRIIGDAADCTMAAGPDEEGQRTVAIIDRQWLEAWTSLLRRLGARRLSALPLQLCLPLPAHRVAAALMIFPHPLQPSRELVLRLAPGEGAGLPLGDAHDAHAGAAATEEVLRTIAALAMEKPLQLSVPADDVALYRDALAVHAHAFPDTELRAESWSDWVDGASQAEVDLMAGIATEDTSSIDWSRWRLPLTLTAAVLLFNVLALSGDWWFLHREGNRLQAEMLRTYRTTFPNDSTSDDAVLADPLGKMKQQRLALQRATGEPSSGDFLALSAAVGDAWPALQQSAGMEARALSGLDYRDGTLQLHIKPGQRVSLEVARKVLAERHLELTAGGEANTWQVRSTQ